MIPTVSLPYCSKHRSAAPSTAHTAALVANVKAKEDPAESPLACGVSRLVVFIFGSLPLGAGSLEQGQSPAGLFPVSRCCIRRTPDRGEKARQLSGAGRSVSASSTVFYGARVNASHQVT